MKRRTFVALAGSLATAGLAGCGDAGPGVDNETTAGDEDGLGDGLDDGTDGDGLGDGSDDAGDTPTDAAGDTGDTPTDAVGADGTPDDATTDTPADGTATPDGGAQGTAGDDANFDVIEGHVLETPENLVVVNHQSVETSDGGLVLGSVRNMGETPFESVTVDVTLDDSDTVVGDSTVDSRGDVSELGPGETWRFVVEFGSTIINQATGYTITVDGELVDGSS